jgi:hypothetical protein
MNHGKTEKNPLKENICAFPDCLAGLVRDATPFFGYKRVEFGGRTRKGSSQNEMSLGEIRERLSPNPRSARVTPSRMPACQHSTV